MSETTHPAITLYGRTYWDVEISGLDLASLSTGKGKVDASIHTTIGGFACNAARSLSARFPGSALHVVTASTDVDQGRLQASLPDGIGIDVLKYGPGTEFPPISVILNPASSCRILRDPMEDTDDIWRIEKVSDIAIGGRLHVLGRLPVEFATYVLQRVHAEGGRFAWCGGHHLPRSLEEQCDIMCVNSAEAVEILGASLSPEDSAKALASRATVDNAVRLVTGGGASATVAALRQGEDVRCYRASPKDVDRETITRLLGVGDAFAAVFLASACFDSSGAPRAELEVETALTAAQTMASEFIIKGNS